MAGPEAVRAPSRATAPLPATGQRGPGAPPKRRRPPRPPCPPPPAGERSRSCPPGVPQHFVPVRGRAPAGAALVYQPMVLGAATVRLPTRKRASIRAARSSSRPRSRTAAVPVDWDRGDALDIPVADLEAAPGGQARLGAAALGGREAQELRGLEPGLRGVASTVHGGSSCCASPRSGVVSRPARAERDFRVRIQEPTRPERDKRVEALRKKYAPKHAALRSASGAPSRR